MQLMNTTGRRISLPQLMDEVNKVDADKIEFEPMGVSKLGAKYEHRAVEAMRKLQKEAEAKAA